ncbi:oxidoreductase [Thozetella sp. PMI_491]|nr:oxidoreductase [Thozetella sp. PMI_491]
MAALLKGVAYITGGGAGIGQATVLAFARYGVRAVTITDISRKHLDDTVRRLKEQSPHVDVMAIEMDVANEEAVNASVSDTVEAFGSLDLAVNNAGLGGATKHTADATKDEFQRVVDINLTGLWMCQRAQLRQMLQQPVDESDPRAFRGSIVNVSSMYGLVGVSKFTPVTAYAPTKHAIQGLVKSDAIAYGSDRIRLNAINPGFVETALFLDNVKGTLIQNELAKVPLGRAVKLEEVADSIFYLSSRMASYATGSALVIDGGYTSV